MIDIRIYRIMLPIGADDEWRGKDVFGIN